jgi:phage shock protein PspC (stress-responsive transcriptional regulator)
MNGNGRLYRSTSEAMLGGVAAGLANYFKIDPTIVRIVFLALTFLSGGTFIIVYLAFWMLLPTAGSTATQPGEIVRENLDDMGSRVRNFTGMNGGTYTGSAPTNGGQPQASSGAPQLPPASPVTRTRPGLSAQVLILIGAFFLLANLGFFHVIRWGVWWPLLLIGLGVIMLTRRNA